MKRKIASKLSLHRETLLSLDGPTLRAAGGETAGVACHTQAPSCQKPCTVQPGCGSGQLTCGSGTGGPGLTYLASCAGTCDDSCVGAVCTTVTVLTD